MFRPYLAVIQDSYRAALSSRVLYIVLTLIAFTLLVLAPFHSRETLDWKLSNSDSAIPKPSRLIERLVNEGQSGSRAAVAHIWNQIPTEFQSELNEVLTEKSDSRSDRTPGRGMRRKLTQELNALLEGESLYDETAFAGKRLTKETQELIERGDRRTSIENRRLNRLLLSTALRRDIAMPGETQIDFYYFTWPLSALSVNMSQSELADTLTSELPGYFDKFIMSIGIFIAILITASIIPEMLQSGSLNLFLSKPVSRWLILLAKYLGGCVFISLCATFLFFGLWLWAGIQLRIWEPALLISIPVYVFVFAMYYAVSVLAGLWFRSPILSITCALLFWAACWGVGSVYTWLDNSYYNSSARQLLVNDEQVAIVDLLLRNYVWEDEAWRSPPQKPTGQGGNPLLFGSYFGKFDGLPEAPGPVFDRSTGQYFFANESAIGIIRGDAVSLVSTSIDDLSNRLERGELPSDTLQIAWTPALGLVAIDPTGGISQLVDVANAESNEDISTEGDSESSDAKPENNLTDRLLNWAGQNTDDPTFKEIVPSGDLDIPNPQAASPHINDDCLIAFSKGSLHRIDPDADKSASNQSLQLIELENDDMTAFVRAANSRAVAMLGNGQLFLIDVNEFSLLDSIDLSSKPPIRNMAISPNGDSLAVAYRNGELVIYDISGTQIAPVASAPGSDFMACAYDTEGQLWTSDRFNTVFNYSPKTGELLVRYQPEGGWMTLAFRRLIRPLYRNFPKPGEFYKLISYLAESTPDNRDLNIDRTKQAPIENPWDPLKSGIIFTVCVLAIACTLFQRLDF